MPLEQVQAVVERRTQPQGIDQLVDDTDASRRNGTRSARQLVSDGLGRKLWTVASGLHATDGGVETAQRSLLLKTEISK